MTQEPTTFAPPEEKIHGTAGTMIVTDVAAPISSACRRLRLGSGGNWLAAMPSPSAINNPITAATTTLRPWVIVASIKAMLATSPSEAPKMMVVRVTNSLSAAALRLISVATYNFHTDDS